MSEDRSPTGKEPSVFLTVTELAVHLRISRSQIYALMQRGQIPYRQFGSRRVIPRAWLDQQVREALEPELIDLRAIRIARGKK